MDRRSMCECYWLQMKGVFLLQEQWWAGQARERREQQRYESCH